MSLSCCCRMHNTISTQPSLFFLQLNSARFCPSGLPLRPKSPVEPKKEGESSTMYSSLPTSDALENGRQAQVQLCLLSKTHWCCCCHHGGSQYIISVEMVSMVTLVVRLSHTPRSLSYSWPLCCVSLFTLYGFTSHRDHTVLSVST